MSAKRERERDPDYCEHNSTLNIHQSGLNSKRTEQRQIILHLDKPFMTCEPGLPFIHFQLISLRLLSTFGPGDNYYHRSTGPQKTPRLLPKYTERQSHSLMVAELGKVEQMACKKSVSEEASCLYISESKEQQEFFHQPAFSQDRTGLREQEHFGMS